MMEDTLNDALIEKLRMFATKPNDNIEIIRSVSARLHSRTASQDKGIKERTLARLWKKDSGSLTLILHLLEVMRDHITACSLAGILHECVSPKLGLRRHSPAIKQLVAINATQVLVKLIQQQNLKEVSLAESLLQELLWVLAQVAQKDAKFSIKVRLLGATKTFHNLLKAHYDSTKMVFPLLLVIKSLAKNSSTVTVLARDGICATMDKTILTIGFSPSPRLRLALNVLKILSKNKLCCGRMVKGSLVPLLLRVFERWERYDGRMKLRICSFTLSTLQHISQTKAGRKAIRKNSGLLLLHKFSSGCPDDKLYDPLLTRVCSILNVCAERHQLPVANLLGPATFALPPGVEIICTGQRSSSSRETTPDSDEDSSDEGPVEDGEGMEEEAQERRSSDSFLVLSAPSRRDMDDLMQYSGHVLELLPASGQLEDWSGSEDEGDELPYSSLMLSLASRSDCIVHQAQPHRHKLYSEQRGLPIIADISQHIDPRTAYCTIASRVRSVLPFVKVAYPDMVGGNGVDALEPLNIKDRRVCRAKLLKSMEGSSFDNRVVYDLDKLSSEEIIKSKELTNDDLLKAGKWVRGVKHLLFESRFESGNLRKAIQINDRDYNLILMPDVNSTRHHQWFYFSVSNMEAGVPYTLNIINCEKQNSQFNYGMKPLIYSVQEAALGRTGWVRTGTDICYFRNNFQNSAVKGMCYYTATFTIEFRHAHDICYLAYHYPYTYSQLLTQLWRWDLLSSANLVYYRVSSLCLTLNGNDTPVITITAPQSKANPIKKRELVFLTARVHPGESNASWVMLGTLRYLLSRDAQDLRNFFVFKVVPMLNIDGVVNGCLRCGLTDEDLNRRWSQPNKTLHPVIYHTKGLLELCTRLMRKPPYVFCDYHGHSRRKNVFLYGCSAMDSWNEADKTRPDNPVEYLMLPQLMQHFSPAFALPLCSFKVERNRETTARVTVWREFGVSRSYTMESTFCGCDQGQYQDYHLSTVHLLEVGANFCQALAYLQNEMSWRLGVLAPSLTYLRRVTGAGENDDEADDSPLASESSDDDFFQS